GHWVLARNYAEKARAVFEELSDRVYVGQLTNNLGGLNFLLGKTDVAIGQLKEAFGIALDTGRDADAAQAVSSLAQIHLRTGNVDRPRSRRGMPSSCSRRPATRTIWTRSGARSSCSGAPCSNRTGSTRPRTRSPRPRRASASSARPATAQLRGSLVATWPHGAATTGLQHTSTALRLRHSRTF